MRRCVLENYDTTSQQSIEHWQASAQKHATSPQAVNFDSSTVNCREWWGAYIADSEPDIVNLCGSLLKQDTRVGKPSRSSHPLGKAGTRQQDRVVGELRKWVLHSSPPLYFNDTELLPSFLPSRTLKRKWNTAFQAVPNL